VGHEPTQRRRVPDDVGAIDIDLTIGVPPTALSSNFARPELPLTSTENVLDRAAEGDRAAAVQSYRAPYLVAGVHNLSKQNPTLDNPNGWAKTRAALA
jgi:hypothetical protein